MAAAATPAADPPPLAGADAAAEPASPLLREISSSVFEADAGSVRSGSVTLNEAQAFVAGPGTKPPGATAAAAVFSGPTVASAADLESHTLPVHSVLPLSMSLTLQGA